MNIFDFANFFCSGFFNSQIYNSQNDGEIYFGTANSKFIENK